MMFYIYKLKNLWQWALPFCAFFTTFSIVMTILVLSTDLKGHHYVHFNNTNVWAFEDLHQESPYLISEIRNDYVLPPLQSKTFRFNESMSLSRSVFSLLARKRKGVFIECGGWNHGLKSGSEYLEHKLGWSGLITQPHPMDFVNLRAANRQRSHTANICISPTTNPKHALFRDSSSSIGDASKSNLTTIPCFPLYSLMLAYNASAVDLLILNCVTAELQVLKTLPYNKVLIGIIMIINPEVSNPCCDERLRSFLNSKGFKELTKCPLTSDRCAFSCSKVHHNCPF